VTGEVELFPQADGWHYVRIPPELTDELGEFADRGLIAVTARLGDSVWDTSLLPMGDGTHFIALKKSVRDRNDVALGDDVTIAFSLRSR
jgi:hypothetical protein